MQECIKYSSFCVRKNKNKICMLLLISEKWKDKRRINHKRWDWSPACGECERSEKNEGMGIDLKKDEGSDISFNILLCVVLILRTALCLTKAKLIKDKKNIEQFFQVED